MPRNDLIQLRSDTAANWASVNPTLAVGEIGFETDTGKFKIGTSTTRTYAIGDIGPGGGKIFITPSTAGNSTGKYFEVAPVGVQVQRSWATGANQSIAVTGADGTAIGTGAQNTIDIVAQSGNVAASSAAVYCSDLVSGGYSDWFLPSKDELNQMYVNRVALNTSFYTVGNYWSSSEANSTDVWYNEFVFGTASSFGGYKYFSIYVRPVRSFTVTLEWEYTPYATDANSLAVNNDITRGGVSLPRGIMSFNKNTNTDSSITVTEEIQITSSQFTAVANRYYKITYYEPAISNSVGTAYVIGRIKLGTSLGVTALNTGNSWSFGTLDDLTCVAITTLPAGTTQLIATLQSSSGGVTSFATRSSTQYAFLLVEDIGAV